MFLIPCNVTWMRGKLMQNSSAFLSTQTQCCLSSFDFSSILHLCRDFVANAFSSNDSDLDFRFNLCFRSMHYYIVVCEYERSMNFCALIMRICWKSARSDREWVNFRIKSAFSSIQTIFTCFLFTQMLLTLKWDQHLLRAPV